MRAMESMDEKEIAPGAPNTHTCTHAPTHTNTHVQKHRHMQTRTHFNTRILIGFLMLTSFHSIIKYNTRIIIKKELPND